MTLKAVVTGNQVTTGRVRASYAKVFTPEVGPDGGEARFSCAFIIPKSDTATIQAIKDAMKAVGENEWGDKFRAMCTARMLRLPLRDGDVEKPDDPNYKGCFFINARAKQKPQVVDRLLNPITGPEGFRSGDYCRVNINAFTYDNKGKGIGFGLNNIQKLDNGEPLGGGPTAAEVFEVVPEEGGQVEAVGGVDDDFLFG